MAITFYKDLPLDFTPHPVSGDIRPITDETAIKRSLKNLLLTNKGSKPFRPDYGSNISNFLFANLDNFTLNDIKRSIEETVNRYESRVRLINVKVDSGNDGLDITLDYIIVNSRRQSSVSLTIRRTA